MPSSSKTGRLYETRTTLERIVRICYPVEEGRLILRTEQDWDRDIEPIAVNENNTNWSFQVEAAQPFLYFKPCLVGDEEFRWSVGPNKLLLMAEEDTRAFYPFFFSPDRGSFSRLIEFPDRKSTRLYSRHRT